jgi:uncharacterized protein (DUF1778 family)
MWLNKKGEPRPIPGDHKITIRSLMEADAAADAEKLDENRLSVVFTDQQFSSVEEASRIVSTPIKDFIMRAAVHAAKQEIERLKLAPVTFPQIKPHLQAAAGSPILSDVTDWDGADNTVLVRINGLSMEPQLHDGEVITMRHKRASRSPWMKKGLIYLVEYDGGFTVKRYNTRRARAEEIGQDWVKDGKVKVLESLNHAFPEIIIKQPVEWVAWLDSTL